MATIQMYSTRWCGYCVRAKTLLESRGIEFEEISLDDDPGFRRRLLDLTGGWTVPQILIDGRPIGGYTELWQLDRSGGARDGCLAEPDRLTRQAAAGSVGQYQVPRPAAPGSSRSACRSARTARPRGRRP